MTSANILFVSAHAPDELIHGQETWACQLRKVWGPLFDALQERDAQYEVRSFHDDRTLTAPYIAEIYTHVVVLTADLYHEKADAFEDFLSRTLTSARTLNPTLRILNSLESIAWNLEKGYLSELSEALEQGQITSSPEIRIRTPQTTFLPRQADAVLELEQLREHFSTLPADVPVYVKPSIGASSKGAFFARHPKHVSGLESDMAQTCAVTHSNHFARVMIQEFLHNITSTEPHGGEWGVYVIAGRLTHVTSRRPAPGDTRTGEDFGGGGIAMSLDSAPHAAIEAARSIWRWLEGRFNMDPDLLYARIDGVLEADGEFVVMEIEMIEPWFWFGTEASSPVPALLADAILRKNIAEDFAFTNSLNGSIKALTGKSIALDLVSDEVYDLICVGFGPANLAVAAAFHDKLQQDSSFRPAKAVFLEKQPGFSWHSGMLIPGTRMQIPFIKDIAAPRDPTSKFTFTNYLHQKDRLIDFTNLGTLYPSRTEFHDYLKWCSSFFDDVTQYDSNVLSVKPCLQGLSSQPVSVFEVAVERTDGNVIKLRAQKVVIGLGGQPSIPRILAIQHPRILHSSQFMHRAPAILSHLRHPRVAVVGGGQSAAEVLDFIQSTFSPLQTFLITRSEFMKPSDDSPFVNEVFNPDFVDDFFSRHATERQTLLTQVKNTNYSVVQPDLIERLYARIYGQKLMHGRDQSRWPHRILTKREIVGVDSKSTRDTLRLRLLPNRVGNGTSMSQNHSSSAEEIEVDVIIAATGYRRTAHLDIIAGLEPLLESHLGTNSTKTSLSGLDVSRDYQLKFPPGKVASGSGVWLQGCCEETHGISDTLLSVVASRSERIVRSMFGRVPFPESAEIRSKL